MIRYKAKIIKDDDGYRVFFPDLEGCFSCGSTLKEAKENAVEAIDSKWLLPFRIKILLFLSTKIPIIAG